MLTLQKKMEYKQLLPIFSKLLAKKNPLLSSKAFPACCVYPPTLPGTEG